MRKILQAALFLFLLLPIEKITAQSCFNVNAGNDTTISCLQPCLNLKARIPNIKSTETYQTISIPYVPFPYTTRTGTESLLVYDDDHFSDSFNIPFPFCFYGNTYTKSCIGSNGVITFDVTANANKIEGYFMDPGDTIFYAGGSPNNQNSYYAPRASIFLAYYDMNPLTSPAERKIEWRVEGSAPCRRFVVSYYHIGNYDIGACPNATNLCTMQAVLYEGTGIIDVFYENKPLCTGYQSGLAIAGLQNWGQNQAVTLPGKNGTAWSSSLEGYRYVPNGATSLLSRVELYKNNVLISTGSVVDLGTGELEATFPNICQTEDSMSYVVRAFYKQCNNPAIETEGSDTMVVRKTLNPVTANVISPICPGNAGSITVMSPLGANIEYSIDGTTFQASNVFTPPPGNYTVTARLVGSLCTGTTVANITPIPVFYAHGSVVNILCNNQPTGQVSFSPIGPNSPYQYSANGGISYQAGSTFTGLAAGPHTYRIKSSTGCTIDTTLIITQPPALVASAAQIVKASCSNNDGEIVITAAGGAPFYTYSLDGLTYQTLNSFTGLSIGNYTNIAVKDANGCIQPCNATSIVLNDQMFLSLAADTTVCAGQPVTLAPVTNKQTDIFKWTPATGLNNDAIKNPVATPADTIRYFLTAQWGICSRTANRQINILRKPVVYAGTDTTICYNTFAFLKGSASNLSGPVKYLWWPAAIVTPTNTPSTVTAPDSTQQYALIVTDNYGCHFLVTDSVLVTVRPKLVPFAGNDTTAIYSIPQQLLGSGGNTYIWSPSAPLNNPFVPNPLATLFTDTRFSLQVSNDIGCTATDDVLIKVYKGPTYYIPNAFSPNGDGLNDVFTPIPVGIASTEYFRVFDRFGQLIFSTNQWLKGWDGTLKGKVLDTGTYVWIIKGVDKYGKVVEMKGTVILVR